MAKTWSKYGTKLIILVSKLWEQPACCHSRPEMRLNWQRRGSHSRRWHHPERIGWVCGRFLAKRKIFDFGETAEGTKSVAGVLWLDRHYIPKPLEVPFLKGTSASFFGGVPPATNCFPMFCSMFGFHIHMVISSWLASSFQPCKLSNISSDIAAPLDFEMRKPGIGQQL